MLASGKLVLQRILKKPDLTPFIKISRRMNYDITDDVTISRGKISEGVNKVTSVAVKLYNLAF